MINTLTIPPHLYYPLTFLVVWSLAWKGYGLWKAAKNHHTAWFVAILLLNTAGVLEILYIYVFSKKGGAAKMMTETSPTKQGLVSFEEFKKLDLRVGKILNATKIEGTNKLVKLEVDLGGQKRQLVAGIGEQYGVDDLTERDIVVVANLEPRTLRGVESQGMLLAASDNGPVLLMPDRTVSPGSKIT